VSVVIEALLDAVKGVSRSCLLRGPSYGDSIVGGGSLDESIYLQGYLRISDI
jgi:hypothetical protein